MNRAARRVDVCGRLNGQRAAVAGPLIAHVRWRTKTTWLHISKAASGAHALRKPDARPIVGPICKVTNRQGTGNLLGVKLVFMPTLGPKDLHGIAVLEACRACAAFDVADRR